MASSVADVIVQEPRHRADIGVPRVFGLMRMAIVARTLKDGLHILRYGRIRVQSFSFVNGRICAVGTIELAKDECGRKHDHDYLKDLLHRLEIVSFMWLSILK